MPTSGTRIGVCFLFTDYNFYHNKKLIPIQVDVCFRWNPYNSTRSLFFPITSKNTYLTIKKSETQYTLVTSNDHSSSFARCRSKRFPSKYYNLLIDRKMLERRRLSLDQRLWTSKFKHYWGLERFCVGF